MGIRGGDWVWGDSHNPVILLHRYLIPRISDCHDIACDLKLGQGHHDLYFKLP